MAKERLKYSEGDIIALVDIGSYSTTIIVVKIFYKNQKLELLAANQRSISVLMDKNGKIEEAGLIKIIYELEQKHNFHIHKIAISIGNDYVKIKNIQCGFRFDYPIDIHKWHMAKIEKHCLDKKYIGNNDIILDLFSNYYSLGQGIIVSDPINLRSSEVIGHCSIIYAHQNIINKIDQYVFQNKLQAVSFTSSAIASGMSVTDNKDFSNISCVISIGHIDTSITIFENGYIKSIDHIQLGGVKIVNNIMRILGVSTQDAEGIKMLTGAINVQSDHILSRDTFPTLPKDQNIRLSDIYNIVRRNLKEMFLEIYAILSKKTFYKDIYNVILTGGVANIFNIEEIAKEVFKIHCTIGTSENANWIINIDEKWKVDILKSPSYTTAIGIGKYLLKKYNQKNKVYNNATIKDKFFNIISFIEDIFY